MSETMEIATGYDENGQQVAYIDAGDGNYTAIPLSSLSGATVDGQELMINLDQLNMANGEGEEMVVIAADDNMDIETLESLIASGAVTTVSGEGGSEMLQLGDGMENAQVIEITQEQLQMMTGGGSGQTLISADGTPLFGTGAQTSASAAGQGGITYRCPSCPAMYANANAFTKHMREKHFVKVYTCRQCQEFFETLSQLFLHARRTHVDPRKPKRNPANFKFHCDQCKYMTNNGGTMEHHKRAHTGEKPYVCDMCGKRFAQKANMKTHRNRHLHRERIFRCETCNKAFSSYDIYLAHLRTREHELREHYQMVASSQLVLECLGCTESFDSIYNLNKHTRSCRIVRTLQTKFRCLPCGEYVNDVASLKAHVKSHEGSHIISCPVCGERGFPGFNQLNHHITRAHALKVNRRHVCRYCESTFETKKELEGHISSMHAEEKNARQSRGAVGRLKCRYAHCEFTTNSIMLLDRHHDQHRRQEEDGDDLSMPLPPARNLSSGKRRGRPPKAPMSSGVVAMSDQHYGESEAMMEMEEYAVVEEEEEDQDIEEDENVVRRRTITFVKSGEAQLDTVDEEEAAGTDADGVEENVSTSQETASAAGEEQAELEVVAPEPVLPRAKKSPVRPKPSPAFIQPRAPDSSGRRTDRVRRLPSKYRDYDTDYAAEEKVMMKTEKRRAAAQAQLPPGMELQDISELGEKSEEWKKSGRVEEWNIVVYGEDDDEEGYTVKQEEEEVLDA